MLSWKLLSMENNWARCKFLVLIFPSENSRLVPLLSGIKYYFGEVQGQPSSFLLVYACCIVKTVSLVPSSLTSWAIGGALLYSWPFKSHLSLCWQGDPDEGVCLPEIMWLEGWALTLAQPLGRRSLVTWLTSQSCLHNENPIKTQRSSWMVNTSMCQEGDVPWERAQRFASGILPGLSLCFSSFNWSWSISFIIKLQS